MSIKKIESRIDFPNIIFTEDWGPEISLLYHNIKNDFQDKINFLNTSTYFAQPFRKHEILIANWYIMSRNEGIINLNSKSLYQENDNYNYVVNSAMKRTNKVFGKKAILRSRLVRNIQKETLKLRDESNKVETKQKSFGGYIQLRRNKWDKRKREHNKIMQKSKIENSYKFKPSIDVQPSWKHKYDWWLPDMKDWEIDMTNVYCSPIEKLIVGKVFFLKKSYEQININKPKKLQYTNNRDEFHLPSIKDEFLKKYESEADVFLTSDVMAVLMCCHRSRLSFDVIVKKKNKKIWFYLRDDSALFSPQVHEGNAHLYVKNSSIEKNVQKLNIEAKLMSNSFMEQVLDKNKLPKKMDEKKEPNSNPNLSNVYVYKSWKFPNYCILCRCKFDAIDCKGKRVKICSTTQQNPKQFKQLSWQRYLDSKFGEIKTTDVNNNLFCYSRWGIESIISGCKSILLGWLARQLDLSPNSHCILKCQRVSVKEFANNTCFLKPSNCWEVLNYILTELLNKELEDGKYVILRDPNKACLRLYQVKEEL